MTHNNTKVFLTVDTEHSIGGAFRDPMLKPVGNDKRIYGRIGDREYGIPLIMDIADEHQLKIVFFVEVLNKYFFGENETREICSYISDRGHEVQLHLHPHYLNFKEDHPERLKYKDNLYHYTPEEQSRLIEEGRDLLIKYGIQNPVAFRAGNYGFNRATLTALKHNDFLYDSSYNYTFLKSNQGFEDMVINEPFPIDGIIEFPITNFIEGLPFRRKRPKPLDINGVSADEIIHTLNWAHLDKSVKYATIIMHSFSFIEPGDAQYSRAKPRQYVIERFEKLCSFLSRNKERFEVIGFNDLGGSSFEEKRRSPEFLHMPALTSLCRLGQQLIHQ